jgi:hypothetical protein
MAAMAILGFGRLHLFLVGASTRLPDLAPHLLFVRTLALTGSELTSALNI